MATEIGEASKQIGLQDGMKDWKRDIADYEDKKKHLQFQQPSYHKVTHEWMKAQECIYNPVTQKYNNPNHENKVTDFEKQNFIDVLAKNKVSRKFLIAAGPCFALRIDLQYLEL